MSTIFSRRLFCGCSFEMKSGLGHLYKDFPAVWNKDQAAEVESAGGLKLAGGWGNASGPEPEFRERAATRKSRRAQSLSWAVMVGPESEIINKARAALEQAEGSEQGAAPAGRAADSRLKRLLDIVIASSALVLIAPLMVAVALAIRLTMGGPVIYAHPRVGRGGKQFSCFKFRSMVKDSSSALEQHLAENPESAREWQQCRKLAKDPRITPLGQFLRRSSIDELPQLFNVLRGEMSCVGPRPVVSEELHYYGEYVRDYLSARPGVTGIWQTCGRNNISYANRVKLDALYVRRWSMMLDLAILLKTARAVMKLDAP